MQADRVSIWDVVYGQWDNFRLIRPHLAVQRASARQQHPYDARWSITRAGRTARSKTEILIEVQLWPDNTIMARAFESDTGAENWKLLQAHNCGEFLVPEFLERMAAFCEQYFPVPTVPDQRNYRELSQHELRELRDRLGIKSALAKLEAIVARDDGGWHEEPE